MVNVSCGITNKVISMKAFIVKSLLTSLYQREEYFPSFKRGLRGVFPSFPHSGGFAEAKAKRGKGRFFSNDVLLFQFLITQAEASGYRNFLEDFH
jgi:hypothetical protein